MCNEKEVSVIINGQDIEINEFVTSFIKETITGMLSSLKTGDIDNFETIEIKINNEN